jgi:hypothetical protein
VIGFTTVRALVRRVKRAQEAFRWTELRERVGFALRWL